MFRVSCLGIWWRHDIWISEKLKLHYFKNENSFWREMKNIFPCFTSALFRNTKQTIKNAADTTFRQKLRFNGVSKNHRLKVFSEHAKITGKHLCWGLSIIKPRQIWTLECFTQFIQCLLSRRTFLVKFATFFRP